MKLVPGAIYACCDLGGSQLKMAIYDEDRRVAYTVQDTPLEFTAMAFIDLFLDWIEDMLDPFGVFLEDVSGIGVAIAGPVREGRVGQTPNIWADRNVNLEDMLVTESGINNVIVLNDCVAAVIGEHSQGAGSSFSHISYVTWSTGIGAADEENGQHARPAELGHVLIDMTIDALRCGCGKGGHLEGSASGTAMAARALKMVQQSADGELAKYIRDQGVTKITAEIVCAAARAGNSDALLIVEVIGETFGAGLATLYTLLQPEAIVIGGGLMKSWDLFRGHVYTGLFNALMPALEPQDEILHMAKLGDESGLRGLLVELAQNAY